MERIFADANEKHGVRYTHHRDLAYVANRVRLKYVAMNLKNGNVELENSCFALVFSLFSLKTERIAPILYG